MPKILKNQNGFIAIVALGILAMLGIFSIIIQSTTIDTVRSVKNTNNYYRAQDIAGSMSEYLNFIAKKKDAGFSLDEITCKYGKYKDSKWQNSQTCKDVLNLLISDTDDVEVRIKIKGRNEDAERFTGSCPGGIKNCYTTPTAGKGSAGDRCDLYTPNYTEPNALVNNQGQIQTGSNATGIAQIDYSCNWNKLQFGSSVIDRAAIPFYYATANAIESPYYEKPGGLFAVRLRTPCLPCETGDNNPTSGETRACTSNTDPTICKDDERYFLNDSENDKTPDDIVVQWQFSGTCKFDGKERDCGLIPKIERDSNGEIDEMIQFSSAISDTRINEENSKTPSNILVISKIAFAIDTNTYNQTGKKIIQTFHALKKPIFTLFLSEKLISNKNKNVPYLEYQILTDRLIGSPNKQLEATVIVNDNIVTKTIYLDESKQLIDFAIQN